MSDDDVHSLNDLRNVRTRRDFLKVSVASTLSASAALAGAASGRPALAAGAEAVRSAAPRRFKLRYAPHFGMFKSLAGEDLAAQLRFIADQGFTALEDNEMRNRPVDEQERIGREMQRLGLRMGVFVAHTIDWRAPTLTSGDAAARERFLSEVRASVDVAKRVNATWMTVVPGYVDPRLDLEYQTANVVESLRRAADVLEPHGLIMVIESLNTRHDHPGMFLNRISQAYMICRAVRSPACKLLFDMYHQQITEGNIIPNIDAAWDEIAYFQVGDNPGRKEPTTGEVNYRNIFRHLHEKGYAGVIGMEHVNSKPGAEGERAVIDAYVASDTF